MLYGVGRWGRWAHIWVFLSIPLAITLTALLSLLLPGFANDKESGTLLIIAVLISIYYVIRCVVWRYYEARG